jgi:hypothetical protein
MPKTFVFIKTHSGVVGQIWHNEQVSGEGKDKIILVFKYIIPEGDQSSLSELIEKFKDDAAQN